MSKLLLPVLTMFVACQALALAEDKAPNDSIQVEVRGTLETGIVAIGGETTGTVIRSNNVTWELDVGTDPKLLALVEKLHMKKAIVTGAYYKKKGVEIPERHIVKVKTLKAG